MSTSKTEARKIDHHLTAAIGAHVMAAQLTTLDPARVDDAHLDLLADVSVRAALALEAAIPRAEDRLAAEAKAVADAAAAEAKAAADAAAAQEAADKAAQAAADEAAAQAAKDAKAAAAKK